MYHIFIEESKLLGILDTCCLSQLILQSSLCSLCLSQLLGNALQYSGLYGCIRTCTLNSQYGIRQSLRQIIDGAVPVHAHLDITLIRVYAQCNIGRQRPGRGRPRKDVSVLIFYFKADDG